MKKLILITIFILGSLNFTFADEYVKGYYRSNGTYVQGYYRSDKNNTVRDNYSYYNNTNPYTGEKGTNKYKNDNTSQYYQSNQIFSY